MGALPSTDLKGYELLKDRVQGSLDMLQEGRALDFKRAATWDELKQGIPKDILAMSNLRDGGTIIIGVEEKDNKWLCTGMKEEELKTYNPDDMIDHVNKYASPSIAFDVVEHTDNEELKYFTTVPL
ncbi:MAG: ATP-binding protein [Planctomycetota bacterium]|nr:ATP-binding protein [Planctomycetota bacterium]